MSIQKNTKDKVQDNTVTITLDYPFTNGIGELVETITLRRPKLKEIRVAQAKATDAEQELYLMTVLSGMVSEDLDLMDGMCDYRKLQEALQEMGKSRVQKS